MCSLSNGDQAGSSRGIGSMLEFQLQFGIPHQYGPQFIQHLQLQPVTQCKMHFDASALCLKSIPSSPVNQTDNICAAKTLVQD